MTHYLKRLPVLLIFLVIVWAAGATASDIDQPFYQNNRFTPLFMVLTPSPDSPDLPEKNLHVAVALDYSSIHIDEDTDDWESVVDLEYTTAELMVETRVCAYFSVKAEIPFVAMGSGFLDGFLNEYHELGNFPDYGRPERPNNEFLYYIRETNGSFWFQAEESGFRPADATVSVKVPVSAWSDRPLFSGYRLNTAVKYSLKVPTGDKGQGLGSGRYDHGFYLLTKLKKENLLFFLSPGVIFPSDPETEGAEIRLKTMGTLFSGIGFTYRKKWYFSAQINAFTSPYDFDIDAFDLPGVELTMGLRYHLNSRIAFEGAFSEDLVGVVPDFTVHSGIRLSF